MYLSDFKFYKPATVKEACLLLEKGNNSAAIAGGTDLLVEMKNDIRHNDELVSLAGISELKRIEETESELIIGSAVTHNEIIKSAAVKKAFPILSETAKKIGSEQVRNIGTIGGNLCTGASCCDMAPVLVAAGAKLEITSSKGKREVGVTDFFLHHKKISLQKGEILTKIIITKSKPGTGISFLKFGLRSAAAISVASAAVMIQTDGQVITDSAIVMGAVAPTPVISSSASSLLKDENLDGIQNNFLLLDQIGEAARKDSLPIDDIRGSASYRQSLVETLSKRALIEALNRAKQSLRN